MRTVLENLYLVSTYYYRVDQQMIAGYLHHKEKTKISHAEVENLDWSETGPTERLGYTLQDGQFRIHTSRYTVSTSNASVGASRA